MNVVIGVIKSWVKQILSHSENFPCVLHTKYVTFKVIILMHLFEFILLYVLPKYIKFIRCQDREIKVFTQLRQQAKGRLRGNYKSQCF